MLNAILSLFINLGIYSFFSLTIILTWPFTRPYTICPQPCCISDLLSHTQPWWLHSCHTALASLLFLEHTRHVPASRTPQWLFHCFPSSPLPFVSLLSPPLPSSFRCMQGSIAHIQVFAQRLLSLWAFFCQSNLKLHPCFHISTFHLSYSIFFHSTYLIYSTFHTF